MADGHQDAQRDLAREISPQEATAAQLITDNSIRCLWIAGIVWGIAQAINVWALPYAPPLLRSLYVDFLIAMTGVFVLWLVSGCGLEFAGRLFVFATSFFLLLEPPTTDWAAFERSGWSLLIFSSLHLIAFGVGWLFDFASCTRPQRSTPILRRITLALIGVGIVLITITRWGLGQTAVPLFSATFGLVCCVWSVWPTTLLDARFSSIDPDVRKLCSLAQKRFGRRLAGRLLAICFCALPVFLFLCSLGLGERLQSSTVDGAVVIESEGIETVFFVYDEGRLLGQRDFIDSFLYNGYDIDFDDDIPFDTHDRLREAEKTLRLAQVGAKAKTAFETIESIVDNLNMRVHSADEFRQRRCKDEFFTLMRLERFRAAPTVQHPNGHDVYHARSLLFKRLHKGNGQNEADALANRAWFPALPFALFCGFSVWAFWRRGGDSAIAIWFGLWLISVTASANVMLGEFYFNAIRHELWEHAIAGSRWAALLLAAMQSGYSICALLFIAGILQVPLLGLWLSICWPSHSSKIRWLLGGLKLMGLCILANIARLIVWCSMFLAAAFLSHVVFDEGISEQQGWCLAGYASFIGVLVLSGAGVWVYRRRKASDYSITPNLSWKSLAAFLCLQLGMLLYQPPDVLFALMNGEANSIAWVNSIVGAALLVAFALLLLTAILRDNFLRLAAVRDTSAIVLVFAFPVMYEVIENGAGWLLSGLGGLLHSEWGAAVLAIATMVFLFGPIWHRLERLFLYFSAPGLRRVEAFADEILERFVVDNRSSDAAAGLCEFLHRLNIDRFAFYVRKDRETFRLFIGELNEPPPEELKVSERLRTFLGQRSRFVDLTDTSYEWEYFFDQFELHRIGCDVHCYSLLPIRIGGSLRALLFLPGRDLSVGRNFDDVAEQVTNVGLETLRH